MGDYRKEQGKQTGDQPDYDRGFAQGQFVLSGELSMLRTCTEQQADEIARLRAALRRCVEAHETGRYEPAQIAYEAAKAMLSANAV